MAQLTQNTIQFMYLDLHEWLIFMVNVGKYTKSHGCYGCLKSYVGKALESPSAETSNG